MHSRSEGRVRSRQRTQHKPTIQIFIHEQTTRGSCFAACHLSSTFQLIVFFSELHNKKYIKRNDRLTLKEMFFDSCHIEEKQYKIVSMKITSYLNLCFHFLFQFLEFVWGGNSDLIDISAKCRQILYRIRLLSSGKHINLNKYRIK